MNEVVLGTAFGILIGPHVANIFDPRSWSSPSGSLNITLEVMRIVLATGLFAIGVELPKNYMWKHVKGLLIMVIPTMAVGWLIVGGISSSVFQQPLCYHLDPSILESPFSPLDLCVMPGYCSLPYCQSEIFLCLDDHIKCQEANRSYYLCRNRRSVFFSLSTWIPQITQIGGKFAIKHVPVNLRRILSAESAANDGEHI